MVAGAIIRSMSDLPNADAARPLRIFVVENHPDTRKYLTMYLEMLGHEVEAVQTMEAALETIRIHDFDVLISDIGLPDGDGWELMQRASFRRPIYAIAMSGFGLGADQVRSKAAGFRHHVLKPFGPDELDSMLEEAAEELASCAAAAR